MAERCKEVVKATRNRLHDSKSVYNLKCFCLFVSFSLTWVNLLIFTLVVLCIIYQQWIKDQIIGHAALVCFLWYPVAALYLRRLQGQVQLTIYTST